MDSERTWKYMVHGRNQWLLFIDIHIGNYKQTLWILM